MSSKTLSSTRPIGSLPAISGSTTRASPTRSSRTAGSAPTSSPLPSRRRRASRSSSTPNGPRTASRRTSSSTASVRRLDMWRAGGYAGVTQDDGQAARLLERPGPREKALLLPDRSPGNDHLHHRGGQEVQRRLDRERLRAGPTDTSIRLSFAWPSKMATGSGKTVVMAMLIAWHALNKFANPQDAVSRIPF